MMPILNPATIQGLFRSRVVRFCAVAVFRMLGGVQGGERSRRQLGVGLRRSATTAR